MEQAVLIQAVKDHARRNYDKDGWDYVVETMDDADIAKAIGKSTTVAGAIRKVASLCGLWNDRREDIQGTAF